MSLLTALQDFQDRTLAGLDGPLARTLYLLRLKSETGEFSHWGLQRAHGDERARQAIVSSWKQLRREVLRSDVRTLLAEASEWDQPTTALRTDELEDAHLSLVLECLAEVRRHVSRKVA